MDKECPKNINGDNVKNIVNRLSTNALQIEQTEEVRDDSELRLIVADAVVKIIYQVSFQHLLLKSVNSYCDPNSQRVRWD
jgi:hypothetical protein